jgi:hypothetical protein
MESFMSGPENGITLPGATIVCGDSHTSTHGACIDMVPGGRRWLSTQYANPERCLFTSLVIFN